MGCSRATRLRDPGRSIDFVEEAEQTGDDEHGAEDTDAGDRVRAAVKDLRHRRRFNQRDGTLIGTFWLSLSYSFSRRDLPDVRTSHYVTFEPFQLDVGFEQLVARLDPDVSPHAAPLPGASACRCP